MSNQLAAIKSPGLFITATDTGIGKTIIASAIANWFHTRGLRVGVCKIAATGCTPRGDVLVSEDAEWLSHASGARFDLNTICPLRYLEPLAPAVAAGRSGIPINWQLLQASLDTLVSGSDVMVVEGVGGIMVPMDEQHMVLDVARWLALPTVIVARPGLGTINHTLLTVNALRSVGVTIAGVVINRYPNENLDTATSTNAAAIEKWGRVPVLCLVPDEAMATSVLSPNVIESIEDVDWKRLSLSSGS